mmetsp:Transcript_94822/g.182235  ORF Transcript_94822/g.182235 Transcript_94822/m.182235 type:complete len:702 (+) Transcript_94822:48-2153(+)
MPDARPDGSGPDAASVEAQSLLAERERASFDVERMKALWLGSSQVVAARERAVERLGQYPVFDRQDLWKNSKYERYVRASERTCAFLDMRASGSLEDLDGDAKRLFGELAMQDCPIGVHPSMFVPTIRLQGSDEQRQKWLPAAQSYAIVGTYCQTEIGHGSDVQGLETTATYIKETEEFEIHTPTVRASKWWPQGLGRTMTHGVVYARLRLPQTNGSMEDKGPKAFLVQFRDLETHENLPGFRSGDIGPTVGTVDAEQGWCVFDHMRVPRAALLCRYGEVLPDGTYVTKGGQGTEKRGYSTMMSVRSLFVFQSSEWLGKACAIAIRYCAARRQFPKAGCPGEDSQVLDYQGVQVRTLPWIASAFALRFTGNKMLNIYQASESRVEKGDTSGIAESHALSSGLKATTTKLACDGIEELRRACGGHGYLHFAGLGEIYSNCMLMFTGEGENYMIIQQLTRWLLKGDFGTGWAGFLSVEGAPKCQVKDKAGWLDMDAQVAALHSRARLRVSDIKVQVNAALAAGKSGVQAAQGVQWDGIQASFAVGEALMADAFAEGVRKADPVLQPVLQHLCSLFCLDLLERNLSDLLMNDYATPAQGKALREQARDLLQVIRPEAVALVDSFCYSDNELNSAIGSYDGDVYKRLLDWAAQEPMNEGPVIKGWHEHWKPLMDKARKQLADSSGLTLADRGLVQQPSKTQLSRL